MSAERPDGPVTTKAETVLNTRGISYFVDDVPAEAMRRDLSVIRRELHCTDVMPIGGDVGALSAAAELALDAGLGVWLRPYLPDRPWPQLLAHLERTAAAAERLRVLHPGRVALLVGTEFSLTAPGIVPGPVSLIRLMVILRARRLFQRRIDRRLDRLLDSAVRTARAAFHGPVGYGAGTWEGVDWSRFDVTGVNLYRTGTDVGAYERRVRALVNGSDTPVVVTEFGCGAFPGADRRGPGSFQIVRWFSERPRIKGDHPRDESVQAAYLSELIDVYEANGVDGCFVFTFAMPDFPRREDPAFDLDKAGFGVVSIPDSAADSESPDSESPEPWSPEPWSRKESFHAVASAYARLSQKDGR